MKLNKVLIITVLLLSSVSCNDWLDLAPEDGVIQERYWQSKEQVHSAVIGCYASLLNGPVAQMFLWGELRADMLENGVKPNDQYINIIDGEISSDLSVLNWSSFYTVINNCNIVLKYAKDVKSYDGTFTDQMLRQYEAEALTIRALMYFYLVRSFRDVPFSDYAFVSDDQDLFLEKTSAETILNTLIKDLQIASANAPISYGAVEKDKSRITAWTSKALLADIYLWTERYEECYALCEEIVASGKFNLIPVEKIQKYITDASEIVIDSVTVPNEGDAERMFNSAYVYGNSMETIFEIPFTNYKNNPFYNLLGPSVNQLRPKIDVVDGIIFPEPTYELYSDAVDIRASGCSFRNELVWKYVGTSRTGVARMSNNYISPWIVYKYSDVLLMQAEALNQIGLKSEASLQQDYYTTAINKMKLVRDARNAVLVDKYNFNIGSVDGKSLEEAILEERAREFAYEGKRWYDVLRYAKRDNYGNGNIEYLVKLAISSASPMKQQSLITKYKDPSHNSHYWPIYINEIETNYNLTQNEFYLK